MGNHLQAIVQKHTGLHSHCRRKPEVDDTLHFDADLTATSLAGATEEC